MAKPNKKNITKIDGILSRLNLRVYKNKLSKKEQEYILYYIKEQQAYEYSYDRLKSFIIFHIKEFDDDEVFIKYMEDSKQDSAHKALDTLILEECLVITDVTYIPGEKVCIIENKERCFNRYKKSKFLKSFKIIKAAEDKYPIIDQILNNISGYDKEGKDWIVNWLAGALQKPTKRVTTACILHGDQGTGKGLFFEQVMSYILGENYNKVGFNQINSEFTGWLKDKQFVFCNEIMHYENKAQVSQSMKEYIADPTFSLREMRKDSKTYVNYSRICIASNGMIPFKVEDSDRRFSVFKSKKIKNGQKIYADLMSNFEEEVTAFVSHLLSYEIDWAKANTPYENQQRKDIIKSSMNSCESFIYDIEQAEKFKEFVDEYKGYCSSDGSSIIDTFSNGHIITENKDYMTSNAMYALYVEYCTFNGFGKKAYKNTLIQTLNSKGYESQRVRELGKQHRVIALNKNE
jgi:phage/plasmid-associated DNA primase